MKKARSKTGFFVLGISFSAFGAEAQDARQKGLRLPEGGFIGCKGLAGVGVTFLLMCELNARLAEGGTPKMDV